MKLESFFFIFFGVTFKSLEMIPEVLRYKVVILEVSRGYFHDVKLSMVLGHIFVTLVVLMTCISIILKILNVFCSFWRFLSYFDHFACSRPEKWVKLVGFCFDLFAYIWVKFDFSKLKWVAYLMTLSRSLTSWINPLRFIFFHIK